MGYDKSIWSQHGTAAAYMHRAKSQAESRFKTLHTNSIQTMKLEEQMWIKCK